MGGLAGHMSHLYDNPRLTFSKIKEIFIEAAAGRLEGTEKTDGQNLYLSFSVPKQKLDFTEAPDSPARGARNKGNIKSGGLTVGQIVAKFNDHPNPKLKKSFSQALRAFENVIKSFPREKQVEIFGDDTDIYYNAEIINPETPNVINYDKKLVSLHRGGGGFFDKETGSEKEFETRDPETGELLVGPKDVSGNANILADELEDLTQDMENNKGFEVIMDAIFKLKALSDQEDLHKAINGIDSEISSEGISEDQMVIEYVIARIGTLLKQSGIKLEQETEDLVIKRLILSNPVYKSAYGYDKMPKELAPAKILKDLHPRDKNKIISILKDHKGILKQAIQPIEHIVHDFSVSMLEGLESLFILDNKKGVEKIKEKVRAAKKEIEESGVSENIKILLKQMEKLKGIENISTAAEGFVFDYDGYTYKFTGNFAPINQILGIGKYDGRGKLPPLDAVETHRVPRETGLAAKGRMRLESYKESGGINNLVHEVVNLLFEETGELDAIYLPGGFKPPHKGHWSMVQSAAGKHPGVPIYIVSGAAAREGVTLEDAEKIWNIYIDKSGLDNVKLIKVDEPIPRTDAGGNPRINKDGAVSMSTNPWEWIKTNVPGNKENIGIVYSEKDENYDVIANATLGGFENLKVTPIMVAACADEDGGCPLSATNFREAISDKDKFKSFIPDFAKDEADHIWQIVSKTDEEPEGETQTFDKETGGIEETIYEMIEDLINEDYTERACEKKDKTPGNCVVKTSKGTSCYDSCAEAARAIESNKDEELEEISTMGGGAMAGGGTGSSKSRRPKIKGLNIFYKKQKSAY